MPSARRIPGLREDPVHPLIAQRNQQDRQEFARPELPFFPSSAPLRFPRSNPQGRVLVHGASQQRSLMPPPAAEQQRAALTQQQLYQQTHSHHHGQGQGPSQHQSQHHQSLDPVLAYRRYPPQTDRQMHRWSTESRDQFRGGRARR